MEDGQGDLITEELTTEITNTVNGEDLIKEVEKNSNLSDLEDFDAIRVQEIQNIDSLQEQSTP